MSNVARKNPRLYLIAITAKPASWIAPAINEFLRRTKFDLVDIEIKPPSRNNGKNINEIKKQEAKLIIDVLNNNQIQQKIVFDEKGKNYSSQDFAQLIQKHTDLGKSALIIGGADGLSDEILNLTQNKVALSALTMPHDLAKLVVLEQIYRALTINNNHPYHRN